MIQFKFRNMKKIILLLTFIAAFSVGNAQIYVNKAAPGDNDGSSWDNAFNHLQDAIDAAAINDEIWVAAGTYYPTASPDGTTTDPRDKAFHLHTDMRIYGGFAGGETELSARNAVANVTILSGDFSNDDVVTGGGSTLSITGNTENAYHVMLTADLTSAALIDGFTIKGGNADFNANVSISYQSKEFSKRNGGGMYNFSSSPTITNSIFTNNDANDAGGGMYNFSSSPTITNSTFTNNNANYDGGGMYNFSSSSTITNSTFTNNSAGAGGGMYNDVCSPTITNSTFTNNNATSAGGGMYNDDSSPTITNSTFTNNSAGTGGGMYNDNSSPTITNSTFTNNSADYYGGGMYNKSSSPTITNSTFTNNNAKTWGGGMVNIFYSSPTITNSNFANNYANRDGGGMFNYYYSSPTITNSIIWDNGSNEVANDSSSTPTFKNSIIKGSGGSIAWNTIYGTDNGANLDIDPLFVDAANGDFNLQCSSPAINNGILAGAPTKDMTGFTRVGNPDMGAYEYVESAPLIITRSIANGTNPTYEGSPSITTEWPILNTNNAVFKARKFIELKPGFLVSPAAGAATVFRAEIGSGCPE
jgi:hypothetical protein